MTCIQRVPVIASRVLVPKDFFFQKNSKFEPSTYHFANLQNISEGTACESKPLHQNPLPQMRLELALGEEVFGPIVLFFVRSHYCAPDFEAYLTLHGLVFCLVLFFATWEPLFMIFRYLLLGYSIPEL